MVEQSHTTDNQSVSVFYSFLSWNRIALERIDTEALLRHVMVMVRVILVHLAMLWTAIRPTVKHEGNTKFFAN